MRYRPKFRRFTEKAQRKTWYEYPLGLSIRLSIRDLPQQARSEPQMQRIIARYKIKPEKAEKAQKHERLTVALR
jgi:hypothetical protein